MLIRRKKLLALVVSMIVVCMTLLSASAEGIDDSLADDIVMQEGAPGESAEDTTLEGETSAAVPAEWEFKVQNGGLTLYADGETGKFAVEQADGYIWWSVPLAAAEDPLAKGKNKTNQQSLMIIQYGNPETNDLSTVSSQAGVVQKEGVSVKAVKNGIRVEYDFVSQKIRVPMEILLVDGHLEVTVPTEEIDEYGDNYLYEIQLLPYMGAGYIEDEGWMLVPDGSGGIINFNNGRQNLRTYSAQVYGRDLNATIIRDIEVVESIRIPVFGVCNGNNAMTAVITGNDALAWIDAAVSGAGTSYNKVYSRFTMRKTDTYVMGQSTGTSRTITLFSTAKLTKQPIQVEYHFLSGEEADLAGMADVYRDYLKEQGMKSYSGAYAQPPVYIDVLGSVYKEVPVLGIPTMSVQPVTTFDACATMLDQLSQKGLASTIVRYTNWSTDLIRGKVSDSAVPESKLGGKKRLSALLKNTNTTIYLDNDLTFVSKWQLGYGRNQYAAKSISNIPTVLKEHDIATFFADKRFADKWLLSPFMMGDIGEKYISSYQKLDNAHLSLGQMGQLLYADYSYSEYTRQDSLTTVQEIFAGYADQQLKLMFTGGNAYAAVYAEHIVDVPVASSRYDIIDESVPFYQMVFHGAKLLGSEAINNAADPRQALLRAVQGGTLLHYSFIAPEGKETIRDTVYDELFRADYTLYMDEAAAQYQALAPLYSRIMDQTITDYQLLADGVTLTEYADGTQVVVNFTDAAVAWGNTTVEAGGYTYVLG